MTIAVDWGVKRLFKQTSKVRFNELAYNVINIFVFRDFAIVPCNTKEKKCNTNGKVALCTFFISIHA